MPFDAATSFASAIRRWLVGLVHIGETWTQFGNVGSHSNGFGIWLMWSLIIIMIANFKIGIYSTTRI
jgi:hypothetical protein